MFVILQYSVCPEHAWQVRKFDPSKNSIFTLGDDDDEACEDEGACDSDNGEVCEDSKIPRTPCTSQQTTTSLDHSEQQTQQQCSQSERVRGDSDKSVGKPAVSGSASAVHSRRKVKSSKDRAKGTNAVQIAGFNRFSRSFVTCGGNCASL